MSEILKQLLSRRSLLLHSAAALLACEATGMPSAYAETAFTVGTLGGSWGDGIRKTFIETPKLAGPISYLNAPYSVLISRLLSQPNNPPYSVADLLDIEHYLAADAGVIQDYDLDVVTNYENILPTARQPPRAGLKNWAASMTLPIISLGYNSKLATTPTKWEDLWSAKYKGKIGIPDFGWFGLTWLHAINKQLGGNETNIDKGIAAVADLVRNNGAIVIKTTEQAIKAYKDEEIVMMPYWNGRAFALQEEGVPVEMAYVPGTIQLHNGFVIARNTPFKDMANRFVNNTLDPVLQLQMTEMFRYPPSNRLAVLPDKFKHYAISRTALDNVVQLDWEKINAGRAAALERWNKEIMS